MRQLAVLLLVIAAIGGLVLALLTLSGTSERDPEVANVAATPASAEAPREIAETVLPESVPVRDEAPIASSDREVLGDEGSGGFPNRLHGIVLSAEGAPVTGAKLTLQQGVLGGQNAALATLFADQTQAGPEWHATSGPDGSYSISSIQPGSNYTLTARHESYSTSDASFIEVPAEGEVQVDVRMSTGFLVHGFVRNEASQPIPEATVSIGTFPFLAGLQERPDPDRREVKTNEAGMYRFENCNAGMRTVTVQAEGYGTQTKQNVQVGQKPTTEVNFRLETGLKIAGRIYGPDRTGIVDAQVEALMYKQELTSRGRAVSVEDGEFVIEDLADGQYQLVVTAPGWATQRVNRIPAGKTDVMVEMSEQGGVEGRVLDASGRPQPSFTIAVRFVNAQTSVYGRAVKTLKFSGRDDGTFSIAGIEQGTYALQASAPGYAPTFSSNFTITQGELTPNVEVRLSQGGAVSGVVLDGKTGQPVAGASVETNENNWIDSPFTQLLGSAMARNTTPSKTRTNASGEFDLRNLTPGTYQIKVSRDGYTSEIMNDVLISDGASYEIPPIRMRAGATVRGTVFDAAGRPLAGAQINITPVTPGPQNAGKIYQARSGSNGLYVVRNIAQGEYKISAARPAGLTGPNGGGSPFDAIIDMKNSEIQISIVEGEEAIHDLYLGE